MPEVYGSAYKLPGRALVVIANLSREGRAGVVRLSGKGLGLAPETVVSWPDKAGVQCTDGRLSLQLEKLSYRMFVVGDTG
jgi:hypothetical protein